MIKYNLECSCGETFESWFQNSSEYEKLLKKNLINCYVCGRSKTVKKSFKVDIDGTWDGKYLIMKENFIYDDGTK